jgi:tRNA (uracil-5-)-methyltransferase TRM9
MNLEQANKILEENRNTYNKIYDEFSKTRNYIWPELKGLEEYINLCGKVLDLGCGNGRLYEMFAGKNIDYVGVDFSENLIERAKEKYGDYFRVANILSLPFSDQYFDSVWSIAALHHIPSNELRKRALSEIKRVLRPNGMVIATCWNLYQPRFFKLLLKSFLSKDLFIPFGQEKRYYHAFTRRELKKLFEAAGFKIEELGFLKRNNNKNNIVIIAKKI